MTQRGEPPTLRCATWNILHGLDLRRGVVDLAAVADAIAGLDVDVVALQEVDRELPRSGGADQAAQIAARLGLYAVFAPALAGDPDDRWRGLPGGDPGGAAYGVALLSRHPLGAVARIPLPGGGDGRRAANRRGANPGWDREPRVGVRASVSVGGRQVTVSTAHLSYLPWRGARQLRRLTRAVGRHAPAVLLGDFNLPPRAVELVARGWAGAGGEPTYPADAPRMQVDQILVRGLRVAGVRVGAPATSDHRPVIADLTLS